MVSSRNSNRPVTHGLDPHLGVTMRCNENNRYAASVHFELDLQLKAGDARHPNVSDQARGLVLSAGIQELFRGGRSRAWIARPIRSDSLQGTLN